MSRVVLTLFCSVHDSAVVADALRAGLDAPVHLRNESVLGQDFDDAQTGERVAGALARVAIELEVPAARVADALDIARNARRRLPFRWRTVAILDGGREA